MDILLAEDNLEDGELTLRTFKKYNLSNKIMWVKNGEEALEYLVNENNSLPKLVLLDLKMPKLSGIDVLQKLRSMERTRELNIVILTSSKEESDIVKSYELGVNSYIVKPVAFNKFIEAVREIGLYWLVLNERPNGK